ncbi:MAG: SpoIIE family protein phosphatase [bacterium]
MTRFPPNNLENRAPLIRLFLGLFVAILFITADLNFYRFTSSPTDENWFRNPPSNLYITRRFPAKLMASDYRRDGFAAAVDDSVLVGDLLLGLEDSRLKSVAELDKQLAALPRDALLRLHVFRPRLNAVYTFLVTRSALPPHFISKLPPTAYVFDVFEGGASDEAGMHVGDLIYRINGQDFKNATGADIILRRAYSGKTISYDVLRDNASVTLQVTLANYGIQFSLLIIFLCGLVYLGVGAFILLKRPQQKAALLIGWALSGFGYFLMVNLIRRDVTYDLFAHFRDFLMAVCLPFGVAVWSHSSFYFPCERPGLLTKRWPPYVLYGIATVFFSYLMLFVFGVLKGDGLIYLGIMILLVVMFGYTAIVAFLHRKQRTEEAKKLGRVVSWVGRLAGMAAFVLAVILGMTHRGRFMGFVGLPLVFIPLTYLYTIGRYHLLDMDLRIRRNIQYTILTTVWIVALVVLFVNILVLLSKLNIDVPNIHITATSIEILEGPLLPEKRELFEKVLLMVFGIGATGVLWKLGRAGQRLIDLKFNRQQYDYRRAANEIAEVMATKLSMVELAKGIVQKTTELLQLKRAGVIFFRDQGECCCQEAFGIEGSSWKKFCVAIEKDIAEVLSNFRSESRLSVNYLPAGIRESFVQQDFRHLLPIRYKGELVGLLFFGEKLSEAPFNHDDLTFLASVAKQASVAIENAFLHEELSEQERLKHELEIARKIQLESLPQTTPDIPGLEIAGISIPAMEVGGDYFDYLNGVNENITIIVGDVSGKGTSAALYMSKVQGIFRSLHGFHLTPRELFIRANDLLCQDLEKKSFITAIGATFDARKRQLVFARAGHLPLFYYQAKSQKVELITPKGLGLGIDHAQIFADELEEQTIDYQSGDVFLFVTDGVTEAHSQDGAEFGEHQLLLCLQKISTLSAPTIRDQIIEAVDGFAREIQQHDDLTVVVVKVL